MCVLKEKIDRRVQASGVPLCIPGKIIYVAKNGVQESCCGSRQIYHFTNPKIDEFSEIYVSSSMGSDHLPDRYYTELQRAFEQSRKGIHVV